MSLQEEWTTNNERYLAAALAWLRLRLQQCAAKTDAHPVIVPTQAELPVVPDPARLQVKRRRLWRVGVASPPLISGSEKLSTVAPPSPTVTVSQIDEARKAMEDAAQSEPAPALIQLTRLLGLSDFEREVLLLCCAMELDTRVPALCARAQDDPARPYPTFALALALFEEPAWDALSPGRPLRGWRLIELHQLGAQPLTASALRADERILNAVKGLNYLDDRLVPFLLPLDELAADSALAASQQAIVNAIMHQWRSTTQPRVIQLLGSDVASKQLIAQRAAAAVGRRLYLLSADRLPVPSADLELLTRL